MWFFVGLIYGIGYLLYGVATVVVWVLVGLVSLLAIVFGSLWEFAKWLCGDRAS